MEINERRLSHAMALLPPLYLNTGIADITPLLYLILPKGQVTIIVQDNHM